MIAIPYEPKHFPMIKEWFKHYGLDQHEFLLPPTGIIIDGMAVGFAYLTNSPVCWFENLCKNPHIDKDVSDAALNMISEELLKLAESNGVKLVVVDTLFNAVIERSFKYGLIKDDKQYTRLYRSF